VKATATEMVLDRNNGMLMIRYSGTTEQFEFEFSKAVSGKITEIDGGRTLPIFVDGLLSFAALRAYFDLRQKMERCHIFLR
jgi:hypothetical protein